MFKILNLSPIFDAVQSAISLSQQCVDDVRAATATSATQHSEQLAQHVQTRTDITTKLDSLVATSSGIDTTATAINNRIDEVHADLYARIGNAENSVVNAVDGNVNSTSAALTDLISSRLTNLDNAVANSFALLSAESNQNENLIKTNKALLELIRGSQVHLESISGSVQLAKTRDDGNIYDYQTLDIAVAGLVAAESFISSVSVEFVMSNGELLPPSDPINAVLTDGYLNVRARLAPAMGAYTAIRINWGIVQQIAVS